MNTTRQGFLLQLSALFLMAATAQAQPASRIFVNGKIVTVDEDFTIAEALAIRGDRILAVGSTEEVRRTAGSSTVVIDLGGKTVIPGLIDNHFHFIRGVQRWHMQARIDGVNSRAKALWIIADKAAGMKPGEWLMVQGGWSEGQFADRKGGFSLEELDEAAPKNPLFIQQTYRNIYANTLALEAAGLSPSDGVRQSGRPAIRRFTNALPAPTAAQVERNLHDFVLDLNKAGLTTVYGVGRPAEGDMGLVDRSKPSIRFFHTLRYRAQDVAGVDEALLLIASNQPMQWTGRFGLLGLGEHIYAPMSDNTMRREHWPPEVVAQFMRIARVAAEGGWQIHEHTMSDVTVRDLLDPFEQLNQTTPITKLRWTFAHVDTITPESIQRAKKLGMTLAVHAKSMHQAHGLARRIGDRVKGIPPLRDMQESGIVWGLGTDSTIVAHYQPFITLWWAVTGKALDGTKVLEKTVSREEALIAHTRSNAYILFKEKDLGALEVGKLADLVVLDRDYLTIPADDIINVQPLMTLVGGQVAFERDP